MSPTTLEVHITTTRNVFYNHYLTLAFFPLSAQAQGLISTAPGAQPAAVDAGKKISGRHHRTQLHSPTEQPQQPLQHRFPNNNDNQCVAPYMTQSMRSKSSSRSRKRNTQKTVAHSQLTDFFRILPFFSHTCLYLSFLPKKPPNNTTQNKLLPHDNNASTTTSHTYPTNISLQPPTLPRQQS